MQIYDRYNGDPTAERLRCEKRMRLSWRSMRQTYKLAECLGLLSMIVSLTLMFVAAYVLDSIPVWLTVLIIICVLPWLAVAVYSFWAGEDTRYDLYIYGMEDGQFLMLNPLYEALKRISPSEIREIRIIPAMRPTSRQQAISKHGSDVTDFAPWGEETPEGFRSHPMVVFCIGEDEIEWRYLRLAQMDFDWRYEREFYDARRRLNNHLCIVAMGENAIHIAWALRESACPLVVEAAIYEAHRELLDGLFFISGMDMNRVRICDKDEWNKK